MPPDSRHLLSPIGKQSSQFSFLVSCDPPWSMLMMIILMTMITILMSDDYDDYSDDDGDNADPV